MEKIESDDYSFSSARHQNSDGIRETLGPHIAHMGYPEFRLGGFRSPPKFIFGPVFALL